MLGLEITAVQWGGGGFKHTLSDLSIRTGPKLYISCATGIDLSQTRISLISKLDYAQLVHIDLSQTPNCTKLKDPTHTDFEFSITNITLLYLNHSF